MKNANLESVRKDERRHPLLRAARVTKHLPRIKGLTALLSFYRQFATSDLMRIDDFDGDLKMDVTVRETIGINLWHAPRLFEKEEREAFCGAVKQGHTVLDVGANIGIYSLLAAKRGAHVFAIEADPRNAATLRFHARLNGFEDKVTVIEMAATDSGKQVALFRNPANKGGSNLFGGPEAAGMVQGRKIDSLNLPPIDICKMDIEGSELAALHGMKETIARSPRMQLLVEWFGKHQNAEGLLSYLKVNFSEVRALGFTPSKDLPEFCNLWASR